MLMTFPTFDELLDRVFYCDSEVFAHDTLFVFISHKTQERFVFHNATCDEYQNFIDEYNPILITYNGKSYDKYILKTAQSIHPSTSSLICAIRANA